MEVEIKKYGWRDELNARWINFKWNVYETSKKVAGSVKRWAGENPEAAATIVIGVVGTGMKIARDTAKRNAVKQEQHWKDTHIYDHSLGRYVELRRKLRSDEYARVLDRKETSGKSLSVVLDEMGFLK